MKNYILLVCSLLLFSTIHAKTTSKLQLDLENINATLDEGFGGIRVNSAYVAIDPVKVNLDNISYALSMVENFFIVEGNGQKLSLDLRLSLIHISEPTRPY